MIKSHLLSLLTGFRYFDGENEQGSDKEEAKKVRESIQVITSKKTAEPEKTETENEKDNDETSNEDSDNGNDKTEEGNEEDNEDSSDGAEESEKTAAELKVENEKLQKQIARLQKRVGRTDGEKKEIARQLAEANAALHANVEEGKGLSEEEVERRANLKAEEKAAEREFTNAVNNLNRAAKKADEEFPTKIRELTQDYGPVPGTAIGILEDLENNNGGEVLAYLAANPDEYEEIYQLSLAKMTNRLNKLSDKLAEASKPKPKQISKAPAPLKPVRGNDKSPSQLPSNPTKNMEEFIRMRNIQQAERRKARGY